jgi:Recombination endonuclease VII
VSVKRTCTDCDFAKEKGRQKRFLEDADYRTKLRLQRRSAHIKRAYGLTLEQQEVMLNLQNSCCFICNRPISFGLYDKRKKEMACIDHNHTTGELRKVLCNDCNVGLSRFNDDPNILLKAYTYLKEYNTPLKTQQ